MIEHNLNGLRVNLFKVKWRDIICYGWRSGRFEEQVEENFCFKGRTDFFFVIKISSFTNLYINWAISSYLEIFHWCIWNKYGKFKTVM